MAASPRFCVAKKSGKLRLVLDCRAINRAFRDCPGIPMGSGACWDELVLDDEVDMWVTLSDIKDYFYACGLSAFLSEWFAFDDIPGWKFREIVGDDPRFEHLAACDWVTPQLQVLPMGWKWSFFFAQLMHSHVVHGRLPASLGAVLEDLRPPPRFGKSTVVAVPYCDNLAVAAANPQTADRVRQDISSDLEANWGSPSTRWRPPHDMCALSASPSMVSRVSCRPPCPVDGG